MIKFEKTVTPSPGQWEAIIRGMRNPKNSWHKMDSETMIDLDPLSEKSVWYEIGPNDHDLMMRLANGGPVHAKYRRMIPVYVDITAPLYWWKEFDTYKIGTVANSCSTMHKIHEKEFTMEDFSCENLITGFEEPDTGASIYLNKRAGDIENELEVYPMDVLCYVVDVLNVCREKFIETKNKIYWDQMIQLLPSSYNQKRTIQMNYEVLVGIYKWRKNHKLQEWRDMCDWIETLPYSEIITGEVGETT